jgi:hypothetical protein
MLAVHEMQQTSEFDAERQMFHCTRLEDTDPDYTTMCREYDENFAIDGIYQITNDFLCCQYAARRSATVHLRGMDALNEKVAFHTTKAPLFSICQHGLDARYASGLFGQGIYVALEPMKANDYSPDKGNPLAVRAMLRCRVLQGISTEFELGRFDRKLTTEKPGTDSVLGYIRRGTELVFYTADRVLVTHIILYRFTNPAVETAPILSVPPNIPGHIVYITAALSEFFSKLEARAKDPMINRFPEMRSAIGRLLKQECQVDEFMATAGMLIGAAPPPKIATQIEAELVKCRLKQAEGLLPDKSTQQDATN